MAMHLQSFQQDSFFANLLRLFYVTECCFYVEYSRIAYDGISYADRNESDQPRMLMHRGRALMSSSNLCFSYTGLHSFHRLSHSFGWSEDKLLPSEPLLAG
jgi:hypothetical protein